MIGDTRPLRGCARHRHWHGGNAYIALLQHIGTAFHFDVGVESRSPV
jgi:hypothetical protein